jgi:hypothetical protein
MNVWTLHIAFTAERTLIDELPNQVAMSAIGKSRHSRRRNIFGRYWVNSGHWAALALNGSVANDSKRTTETLASSKIRPSIPVASLVLAMRGYGSFVG